MNKPNCWQEALILYLVSENDIFKANQFRCLKVPDSYVTIALKKASDKHNKHPDLAKQECIFSSKT